MMYQFQACWPLRLFALLALVWVAVPHALAGELPEAVEFADLAKFPDSYLGREVTVFAVIAKVEACQAPGNKGFFCIAMRNDSAAQTVLVTGKQDRSQLIEWAKETRLVQASGRVEMRASVKGPKSASLVATLVRPKELHTPTLRPIAPNWSSTSGPQVGHTVYFDSRSVEVGDGRVSAWLLANRRRPELAENGPAMSSLYWLTFACDGGVAAVSRVIHFQDDFARGSLRGRSDVEASIDFKNGPLDKSAIFAAGIVSLKGLCP